MTKVWRKWALAGLILATAAAPALAQPITVAPGNDGWTTPANSSTIDLSIYPLNTVFPPGTVINPLSVSLSGVPLNPGGLGSIDTLMERYPPSVTFVNIPETHTFSVEIQALRMRGQTLVNGQPFWVYVVLSSDPSGPGLITANRLTPDGGRFNSSFPVKPKLIFVNQANNNPVGSIDCGWGNPGCPQNVILSASNVCWEVAFGPNNFNPANFGITPIAAGIGVDSDLDGINDYTTVGRKRAGFPGLEFHVGRQPAPPWAPCADTVHDHAVFSLTHVSRAPKDCPTTTTGTTTGVTREPAGSTQIDSTQVGTQVGSQTLNPQVVVTATDVQRVCATQATPVDDEPVDTDIGTNINDRP